MEAENSVSRRRVIEVGTSKKVQPSAQPTSSPAHHDDDHDDDETPVRIPLELWPVVRTLVGYGRRIHGIGGLRGAGALERVVDSLIPLLSKCPELIDVIVEARNEAQEIRALAQRSMTGEQEDD